MPYLFLNAIWDVNWKYIFDSIPWHLFQKLGFTHSTRFSDFTLLKPSLELAPHSGRITDIPWGFTESFCLLEHASEVRLKSLCNCPR